MHLVVRHHQQIARHHNTKVFAFPSGFSRYAIPGSKISGSFAQIPFRKKGLIILGAEGSGCQVDLHERSE